MRFKSCFHDNIIDCELVNEIEVFHYTFDNGLFKYMNPFYCLIEKNYLESNLNGFFKAPSSGIEIKSERKEFYWQSSDPLKKLKMRVSKSQAIKKYKDELLDSGVESLEIQEFMKLNQLALVNKLESTVKNIYKSYIFNRIFAEVINLNLTERKNRWGMRSLITPDFNLSKNFYAGIEYYSKINKVDTYWLDKYKKYFEIFFYELNITSALTFAISNDIIDNNELDFFERANGKHQEVLSSIVSKATRNVKKTIANTPLLFKDINSEIKEANVFINLNNFLIEYNELKNKDFNSFSNKKFGVNFGSVENIISFPNIENGYEDLLILLERSKNDN